MSQSIDKTIEFQNDKKISETVSALTLQSSVNGQQKTHTNETP